MKRSYFAPDNFEITVERLQWAVDTFKITKAEVERQTELWHEYEYRRAYSDWNRAWKRWFRMAQKYDTLKRPLKARQAEQVSDKQRKDDARKAVVEMAAYRK